MGVGVNGVWGTSNGCLTGGRGGLAVRPEACWRLGGRVDMSVEEMGVQGNVGLEGTEQVVGHWGAG